MNKMTKKDIIELNDLPYKNILIQLRQFMEENYPDFPNKYCHDVAKVIENLALLDEVAGDFVARDGTVHEHGWNYDKTRRLYIDITQDQFRETRDKIVILPDETEKLVPKQFNTVYSKTIDEKFSDDHAKILESFQKYRIQR